MMRGLRRKNAKSKSCSPHQLFDLHRNTYSAEAATFVIKKFTLSIRLHLKQLSQADNAYIISLCILPLGIKPSHSNADSALLRQPCQLGKQAGERSSKKTTERKRSRNVYIILVYKAKCYTYFAQTF